MSDESRPEPANGAPKRRGKAKRKHAVGRVILISAVVLALITGLGMVYFIRHLNGNITGVSLAELGDDRPEKVYKGNGEPLNILVMGSDSRDCDGCGIDQEGGGGSDTTILVHLSADRQRAYAVSIPRDSIIDRPECGDSAAATDVMWNAAYTVGGPVCTVAQLEANTDIFVDHFVVVDFNGFGDMVDAVGRAVGDPGRCRRRSIVGRAEAQGQGHPQAHRRPRHHDQRARARAGPRAERRLLRAPPQRQHRGHLHR